MLQVNRLNHYYGESHTLWNLDLEVQKGRCTCLMGRNGVGKTTLLMCIMGLLPIKSGRISFNETDLTKLAAERRAELGIGYVPQGRQIFPLLTVEENLEIGLTVGRKKKKQIPDLVFELFPVLHEMLKRCGGDLSGGQQQQLAIGRALILEPTLLILDEPTEGIQPNLVSQIGNVILRLNKEEKITVLLVEQKLSFARRVAQHFCIMDKGHTVAVGLMQNLNDELIQKHLRV